MLLIFIGSCLPGYVPLSGFRFSDKGLHTVVFGVLAVLFCRAISPGRVTAGVAALSFLLAAAYGATDELHQWMVPSRVASWADFAADAVGAALGALGYWSFWRFRRR